MPGLYACSSGFRPVGIVADFPQTPPILLGHSFLHLRSGFCQPFNTHRARFVQRFSPIHF